MFARLLILLLLLGASFHARAADLPGVSPALYASPFYTCAHNYYVNGNAASTPVHPNGLTPGSAWHTLQAANDAVLPAGSCVNVAPATYTSGVLVTHGGNLASPTGYVVYRCSQLDACTITDTTVGGSASIWVQAPYVMIDGFKFAANPATNNLFSQGLEVYDGNDSGPNSPFSTHHVWLLNSIVTGYGQSGVQMNDGEYFFVVHSVITGNANLGCQAQGSGVSFGELKAIPGTYTRTAYDASNSILGNIGNFNNAVFMDVLGNNAMTRCGTQSVPYDTDGNDLIFDYLDNGNDNVNPGGGTTGPAYPGYSLTAFDVIYNGGGRGVHIFRSENVTVANVSCYNSDLDPYDTASFRPCIGDDDGYNNTVLNNLAVGIVGPGYLVENSAYAAVPLGTGWPLDTYFNNASYCVGAENYGGCTPTYTGDVFNCSGVDANFCNVAPGWVDVGNESQGTETTPPVGVNFALTPGSAAIGAAIPQTYLPSWTADLGACDHSFTSCP